MKKEIFRIQFYSQNKIYEIYATSFMESEVFGFIEIEDMLFNTKSQVVVDPSEEKLKAEFADVKRLYIPMHSIIRIDEVKKQGIPKIYAAGESNVAAFPNNFTLNRASSEKG